MRFPLTMSVVVASLLLAGSAEAEPFIPKINVPESYKDVHFGLDEMRKNIDSVQCGGWTNVSDASVSDAQVTGYIPTPQFSANNPDGSKDTVTLPGRRNTDPLGKPTSGLGQRGDFEYPNSAFGFSSACDVMNTTTMDDPDIDSKTDEDGNVTVRAGEGTIDINPFRWCMREEAMEKATPTWCKRLFDALRQIGPKIDDLEEGRPLIGNPLCRVPKKYCFDFTSECRGQDCRTLDAPFFSQTPPECHEEEQPDGTKIVVIDKEEVIIAKQASFFRHYAGNFMEPGITVEAPGSDNRWNVRAECYEYYREFDPKVTVTSKDDEQCEFVIATDGESSPRTPEWRPDDEGHKQKEPPKREGIGPEAGPDFDITREPPRDDRNVPDPWVPDTETNLTLIDIKKLKEQQEKFDDPTDVTAILGTLLTTRQTGSKTVSKNGRTDQFDDSDERKMAMYLEAQQRELLKMTADPQTRLIMPARFLVGLAADDPLFQYVQHTVSRSDGTVEITLKAGLEDIGNVLKSFQRVFVAPIQEVRIPVLVPQASVSEIDARIADWNLWKQDTDRQSQKLTKLADTLTDPAAKAKVLAEVSVLRTAFDGADPLIARLEQYRERVQEVRLLRGALLTYLQKLYESQEKIREYFADWYQENSDLLLVAQKRAVERRELKRIWRLLQRAMLQTDACQMYWCSNQRYSAPVYSLLDDWWGENSENSSRDLQYAPRSLTDLAYQQPSDQLFDFSNVKFPSEPWLIPTLWPVQVRVRLPTPPLVGVIPSAPEHFPELAMLPDEFVFDTFPVPEVSLPEKSSIRPPETSDLEEAKNILRNFRLIVDGTDIERQIEEERALADGESIDGGDDNFPLDRESMRGTYCRFPPSILIPPDSTNDRYFSDPHEINHDDPDDEKGNPAKIIHVESDLRERLERLFSRWMPNRDEDFAGRVARRSEESSDLKSSSGCHEGVVCYFLPSEKSTTTKWQWFMPNVRGGNFTQKAAELREIFLPINERENPYIHASLETLQRMFPNVDLPIVTKLTIPQAP